MTDLTAVSLFAGIGGFDLALERVGVKVVAAVEIDKAAREILARRFPETTLFEDVREVTGDALRAAGFVPERGIITAGWPCQGNSVAGRRGGLADPRSGLWSHVRRLLAETSAAWFFGENVPGLLSVNQGEDFAVVLDDLAGLGMGFCWRVLDAQHFGVPQRRRRVFLVGCAGGDARGPVEVLLEPEGRGVAAAPGGEARQEVAGTLGSRAGGSRTTDLDGHGAYIAGTLGGGSGPRGWAPDTDRMTFLPVAFDAAQITSRTNRSNPKPGDPAASLAATSSMHVAGPVPVALRGRAEGARIEVGESGDPSFTLRTPGGGSSYPMIAAQAVRRLTPLECERLQGFPDRWTDGQSDAARYRQLGNAVAVPVVEWTIRRLVSVHARREEAAA